MISFDSDADETNQPMITLQPGQMVFVISAEELVLPTHISGTVYSRNKLQKKNILALNAGHIDPGYEGPIIIRLINLGATQWPLPAGEPVFTVVFHTVESDPELQGHARRTKKETLEAARETAVQAFTNPFFDLYTEELDRKLRDHYSKVEQNLRISIGKEMFRKEDIKLLVAEIVVAAGLFIFALFRAPWLEIWNVLWGFLTRT